MGESLGKAKATCCKKKFSVPNRVTGKIQFKYDRSAVIYDDERT